MFKVKKHCFYCNSVIYGRADKKFCGDNCRSSYNNSRKREIDDEVLIVRKTLMRNRRVISQLLRDGTEFITVSKDRMALMGYNFKYHTHHYRLHSSKFFWFCFEYGYLEQGEGKLMLLRDLGEKYLAKMG